MLIGEKRNMPQILDLISEMIRTIIKKNAIFK